MKILTMLRTWLGLGILLGMLLPLAATAAYPNKPVTLVVPFGPGGASDLTARALSSVLPNYLGKSVLVVNRAGAGGVVGSSFVNHARPDGYTVLLARIGSQAIAPALNASIPYEWDGFTVIALVDLNPYVFVVNADSPYKTFDDLVQTLKNKPGELSFSTSGPDTALNMGPQLLFDTLGLPTTVATQVPYKSGGAAVTAVLGKHVDFVGVNLVSAISGIQAGKLRALAVTTKDRVASIPDTPTVAELGYPRLETVVGWSAIYGPPKLPQEVVDKWVSALQQVAKDKTWLGLEEKLGSVPDVRPPEATTEFVRDQYETYRDLGEKLGLITH